ncbi:MAG: hypothetical protein HYZ57_16230 [Acidobacteria bacterium]|nr:hypothetical protein [Acidobacteriota bacterium]MBI3281382.1 hypothetical protein [Acidobacteriota bacterium]
MKTGEPEEERQQLLNRILASREFAHAHILKRILRYLVERSAEATNPAPKEYEIAVQAMGRPERFDPRTDPIVRVSVASIRDRLLAYFAGEGQQERLHLSIPKGQYLAVFTPTGAGQKPADEAHARSLGRFWKPYLSGQAANVIVYTEPLFFRDDHGHYFRDWYVNDLATGREQLRTRLGLESFGPLHPSFHYLSTGEVHCMLSLSRMFHEMGLPLETRNSRISSWNELGDSNLILLGSPRTNNFVSTLQGEESFVVDADRIENRGPVGGEQACYRGRRYLDGNLMRMSEYALVTRRPGLSPGCAVTMIAANHGRAIEGAGHFLTLEDRVQSVIETMGLRRASHMPPHFQLLMQVETIDVDDEVARVQCVAHRVIKRSG